LLGTPPREITACWGKLVADNGKGSCPLTKISQQESVQTKENTAGRKGTIASMQPRPEKPRFDSDNTFLRIRWRNSLD
jgi:hypothetical protein